MKSSTVLASLSKLATVVNVCVFAIAATLLSCSKDGENATTQTYSTAHLVSCHFETIQYRELNTALSSPGEYCTIRLRQIGERNVIEMKGNIGETPYNLNAETRYFSFGLGGLIVGINNNNEPVAYDLACPNCNSIDYRLTIQNGGLCLCDHCHISYSLNNYGAIVSTEGNTLHPTPRGLFRYRISWNGNDVWINN